MVTDIILRFNFIPLRVAMKNRFDQEPMEGSVELGEGLRRVTRMKGIGQKGVLRSLQGC